MHYYYSALVIFFNVLCFRKSKQKNSYQPLHKKLMHGSLVAFIVDGDFDNILYATVETILQSSDDTLLKFSVSFLFSPNSGMDQVDGVVCLLGAQDVFAVVCPTYYKAFKPVMDALQRRSPKSLPFKEELVFCDSMCPADPFPDTPMTDLELESSQVKNTGELAKAKVINSATAAVEELALVSNEMSREAVIPEPADDANNDRQLFELENYLNQVDSDSVYSDCYHKTESVEMASLSESETVYEPQTPDWYDYYASSNIDQGLLSPSKPMRSCLFKPSLKYRGSRLPAYLKDGESTINWNSVFNLSLNDPDLGYFDSARKVDFGALRATYESSLDHSQLDAIELALHNRVAVIQGPPGTGKTLIGFRLAELLLSVSTRPPGPILVVSYKNHILNEFLKGCLSFCQEKEVVRIGGQRDKLSNTRVTHFKNMCPRPHLPVSSLPDEFKGVKKVLDIVPLIVEFMPLEEVRGMVRMVDHRDCEVLKNAQEDETRDLLISIATNHCEVYRSDCPLDKLAGKVIIAFAKVIRCVHEMLTIWLRKETSLEDLLTNHGVLRQAGQLSAAATWSSKVGGLSAWDHLEVDEDDGTQFLELERDFEPVANGNESKFVVQLSPAVCNDGRMVPVYAVDAARIEPTLMKEEELRRSVSHIRVKRHMKQEELAHMVKLLVQLKWKTSIAALRQKSRELSQAFAEAETEHIRSSAKQLKKEAKVVGMTTDGAAIYQEMLHLLQPAIVIIEEAAEILEPQVLAVLSLSVQHLIMIGDHKQLRPPVETHELRIRNKFDVSMFERLINNHHPHVYLTHQGRMLSKFVPLLDPIYDNLQTSYTAVKRMSLQHV